MFSNPVPVTEMRVGSTDCVQNSHPPAVTSLQMETITSDLQRSIDDFRSFLSANIVLSSIYSDRIVSTDRAILPIIPALFV